MPACRKISERSSTGLPCLVSENNYLAASESFMSGNRLVRISGVVLAAICLTCPVTAAEDEPTTKTWEGTWMNRKYNSSGPLKCVAKSSGEDTAEATFSGTFMKDPFTYDVTVSTKKERDRMALTGTAQLDGDKYEWSGYVRGRILYGQFRSLKGHNGEFRLTETGQ